jgi:hydroxyacylglutathione hydrolase
LCRNKIQLTTAISTSHLEPHAGGNEFLASKIPGLRVISFDKRVAGLTHLLKPGELFSVGQQRVRAILTPGVTEGSGVFHILSARRLGFSTSPNRNPHSVLFSGDTLQVGGCGKFDPRDARAMYRNLIEVLGPLPNDTEIYCSHEHALHNLEFAEVLGRGYDRDVNQALERVRVMRSAFEPTVPGLLEDEFLSNPFLRVHQNAVAQAVGMGIGRPVIEVMRVLSEQRHSFDLGGLTLREKPAFTFRKGPGKRF